MQGARAEESGDAAVLGGVASQGRLRLNESYGLADKLGLVFVL